MRKKISNAETSNTLKAVYALQNILAVCDISVLRVVTVIVDADTKDAYIVNSYFVTLDIETINKIDKKEAIEITKKEYKVNNIQKADFVIYNDSFKGNVLVWYIETDSFEAPSLYMDANTGNILYVDAPIID